MAATTMKASFPLLMLLGIAFLASVCVANRFKLLLRIKIGTSGYFKNLTNIKFFSRIHKTTAFLKYKSKPHTIFLLLHTNPDDILVVLGGKTIFTVLKSEDKNSFNLRRGDIIKILAGTIAYLLKKDDNDDVRVLDLVIP
ncbi:unnamed protein product [Lathyrus oleraceus]